ncbi:VOC family protein [Tamlana sp. 2201CG12-4]|uniref:VOC family protein n=1 Tax=Tamlana sp. 2201CG12-4 TaxID=3112582 RepID=UPI002DB747AD|nr:VOC family protein [Tamlana sp. 2201CG12-4]MEC3907091.1 VOC family protein [Tamlana sp. 2201CG12-4]
MLTNNPFFADLSTYSPEKTIPFYENVFEWNYYKADNYYTAYLNDIEVTGLYETPEKFKQMRMPHFWMTYIQVANVSETIEIAKHSGGIIEANQEMKGFGNMALIRDPNGAGFTVYQGNMLKNTRTKSMANTLIWNELHVSDADNVIPFYQSIFDWQITQDRQGIFTVLNHQKEHIADILEIANDYKGKYEYWVCTFGVDSLQKTKTQILKHGGQLVLDEGHRMLFTDHSHEAFFYIKEVSR